MSAHIEDRLAASLRFDAINGSAHERSVVEQQISSAVTELRRLRAVTPASFQNEALVAELRVRGAVAIDWPGRREVL